MGKKLKGNEQRKRLGGVDLPPPFLGGPTISGGGKTPALHWKLAAQATKVDVCRAEWDRQMEMNREGDPIMHLCACGEESENWGACVGGRRDIHHIWGFSLPLFQFVDHIHLVPREKGCSYMHLPVL
jgi:hypothetical protein